MELKKIWMAPNAGKQNRYLACTLGGALGIAALAVLLLCGGVVLSLVMDWPRELSLTALCLCVTVLAVSMAVRLGRRSLQAAGIFFLTADDRLFALDARRMLDYGHGLPGYAAGTARMQEFLRSMAEQPFLPAGADEICRVERIKELRTHYVILCRIRRSDRPPLRRTYFLIKGCEDEALLLRHLERRESWENALEPEERQTPLHLFLSALAFAGSAGLCALSHPALARLPQALYFPCLGAAFLFLCCLVWLIVRQRRGE